jgi:hypothetical protein
MVRRHSGQRDCDRTRESQARNKDQIMSKLYYSGAPNPTKVALFLEEAGLPYEPIDVGADGRIVGLF